MSDKPLPPPPPPQEFYFKVSLYAEYAYNNQTTGAVWEIEYFSGTVDACCPWCARDSVFSRTCEKVPNAKLFVPYDHSYAALFTCTRDPKHVLRFDVRAAGGTIQKIGQYPSMADLAAGDLKKYRKVLGKDRLFEFNRAIGLAAHGVGIGAFVYLRRIFESLVREAAELARQDPSWDEEMYAKNRRMDEKIDLLRNHLPDLLVQNRNLYGILSIGIHELTEDECQGRFPVVKTGIEIILDAKLEEIQKREKQKQFEKDIQSLNSSLIKKP